MSLKPKQYPYPVLAYFTDDYDHTSQFYVEPNLLRRTNDYLINVAFILFDRGIEQLLDEEKATFVMYVSSPKTLYRDVFVTTNRNAEFILPLSNLEGKIEYQFSIIATEDIRSYSSDSFRSFFDGISFDINKGEPLAVAEPFTQNTINETIDSHVPSIFNIVKKEKAEPGYLNFTMHTDKIIIELGQHEFKRFNLLKSVCPSVLSSIVIIPVLTNVIEYLRELESFEEFEENKWFLVLENKLKSVCEVDLKDQKGFKDESTSVYYATKLLSGSLNESLTKLEKDYYKGD